MAARNPRSHPRRTKRQQRRTASWAHRPAVWLATLSTVVGVATGMFTLRDQVFPGEGSTASAVNAGAYQAHVGRICDEINESEKLRRQGDRKLARQLESARGSAICCSTPPAARPRARATRSASSPGCEPRVTPPPCTGRRPPCGGATSNACSRTSSASTAPRTATA